MLRIAALLMLWVTGLWATGTVAGPWPMREGEGQLHLTLEARASSGSDLYATLYSEFGIGGERTLGLDLGQSDDHFDKAIVFLRKPFGPRGGDTVMAYEIGVGAVDGQAALRPGVSVGKGFTIGARPGWVALDARGAIYDGAAKGVIETDLTLGAETARGDKWMVQLQMAAPSGSSPYVKIAPSYAFRQGQGRHLLLGATAGLVNDSGAKITFGLWQKF